MSLTEHLKTFEQIELELAKIVNKAKDAKTPEGLLSDVSLYIDKYFNRDEITGKLEAT